MSAALRKACVAAAARIPRYRRTGTLHAYNGLVAECRGPDVSLGQLCHIESGGRSVLAEVVGFRGGHVLLMPFDHLAGVMQGAAVLALDTPLRIPVATAMLGRTLDAFGHPLDGGPACPADAYMDIKRPPINPLEREPLDQALHTGVKVIDGLLPLARGQRVGVFAGSGVGKSTLLGMLANHTGTEVIVVALVGERGREVGDFLRDALDAQGRARTVLLVATADQPALQRTLVVHSAHAVAEYFREQGRDVLLIVDSMTRFAMAQREIGLAAGEPPTSRGYPPSVFNLLPTVLERAGRVRGGASISAVYSVLVEGDDMNDPVADHMRAILDGHIVLSREIAARGQLPAVDVLSSVSRLASQVTTRDERQAITRIRSLMATYESSRDLIDMGGYHAGANPTLDAAIAMREPLMAFLNQSPGDVATPAITVATVMAMARETLP
jgi:flagellum-specific ATP synthase